MRSFEELVAEAEAADVTGWDFGWLDGRATEERPPWGYASMLAQRLTVAHAAVDLDTGGGEIIATMPELPARMAVTESWAPNRAKARTALEPRGVEVHAATAELGSGEFDLVTARHPTQAPWSEIARLLSPVGTYFAQHVGPGSAFELIEFFLGPLPRTARDPQAEAAQAELHGLEVIDLRTARCRMEFLDVGAVVYILRKCVWWVPDFSVGRYERELRRLDALIRENGSFRAHSTRHLLEARTADPTTTLALEDGAA